jgi:hypothetical protein
VAGRPRGVDVTRIRAVAWWLRRPSWQFQVILPNQVLFWVVIVVGFVGAADFDDNFATCITWYVWFTLVFLLVLLTGRGWCAVCPFGGLAEWLQRGRLWHGRGPRRERMCGGRPVPRWLARYGYVTTALTFGVLTWVEEYFEVADSAAPSATSWTVIGIIAFAVVAFLRYGRRAFCRYLCPLGGLIGVLGAGAPVRGFHARDPRVCSTCVDKECLRGNERAYGCPWQTWPGGSPSNLDCGLCGECFRSCSKNNIGLFVDAPLSGLVRSRDRRADAGWTVVIIGAIMIHQHVRAAEWWTGLNDWAIGVTGIAGDPNPVLYAVMVAVYATVLVLPVLVARRLLYRRPPGGLPRRGDSFLHRATPFRAFFLPLSYAAIPLVAVDFLTVDLLGFMQNSPKVVRAAAGLVGVSAARTSWLSTAQLMSVPAVVALEVILLGLGGLASVMAFWRIAAVEITPVARSPRLAQLGGCALLLAGTGMLVVWYIASQGNAG